MYCLNPWNQCPYSYTMIRKPLGLRRVLIRMSLGLGLATSVTIATGCSPSVSKSCADGGECHVGDIGPGGGTVFFVSSKPFRSGAACGETCRYLEVAPNGWNTNVDLLASSTERGCPDVGSTEQDPSCWWLGLSVFARVPITTGESIGAGYTNTSKMTATDAIHQNAVSVVQAYRGGDRLDWYIGSKQELNELCKFARNQPTGDISRACTSSGSLRRGFRPSFYWSSSESQPNRPWGQEFGDSNEFVTGGEQTEGTSVQDFSVRPMRAF